MTYYQIDKNYLHEQNGCQIIQESSAKLGTSANNILNSNNKAIWVTQDSLPQWCIINMRKIQQKLDSFNRIGFYCWHQYDSHPSLIEVSYKNQGNQGWIVAAKLRLSIKAQWQFFKINPIPSNYLIQIKITLVENFGDNICFLNQISMNSTPISITSTSIDNKNIDSGRLMRQKNYSEYSRLTSSQKQLKKTNERMKKYEEQQIFMRQTIQNQQKMINRLQNTIKMLAENVEKLHVYQQEQQNKINSLIKQKNVARSMSENKQYEQKNMRSKNNLYKAAEIQQKYKNDIARIIAQGSSANQLSLYSAQQHQQQQQQKLNKKKKKKFQNKLRQYEKQSRNYEEQYKNQQQESMLKKLKTLLLLKKKKQNKLRNSSRSKYNKTKETYQEQRKYYQSSDNSLY